MAPHSNPGRGARGLRGQACGCALRRDLALACRPYRQSRRVPRRDRDHPEGRVGLCHGATTKTLQSRSQIAADRGRQGPARRRQPNYFIDARPHAGAPVAARPSREDGRCRVVGRCRAFPVELGQPAGSRLQLRQGRIVSINGENRACPGRETRATLDQSRQAIERRSPPRSGLLRVTGAFRVKARVLIAATMLAFGVTEPLFGQMLVAHRIPAALAMEAVEAAVTACTQQGYGVTATVIDADAQRIAVLRGDTAGVHTFEASWSKAYTTVAFATILQLDSSGATASRLAQYSAQPPPGTLPFQPPEHMIIRAGCLTIKPTQHAAGAIGSVGRAGGRRCGA